MTWKAPACGGRSFPVPRDQVCYPIYVLSSLNRRVIVTAVFSLSFNILKNFYFFTLQRARAQSLVHSLSLIMVDASLGTIQCLEQIVSTCLPRVWIAFVIISVHFIKMIVIAINVFGLKSVFLCLSVLVLLHFLSSSQSLCRQTK